MANIVAGRSRPAPQAGFALWTSIRRNPTIVLGGLLLALLTSCAIFAPWVATRTRLKIDPVNRLQAPSAAFWFGTDQFGRDVFSPHDLRRAHLADRRPVGGDISSVIGLAIGLRGRLSTASRRVVMRVMDGLMAIPAILLAIALITLNRPASASSSSPS
jgi:peptide/nickel transport system permease protein